MSQISLTASMRSNLASLKAIQGQMDTTQTRLSTGKKVNSAIDNASSYYQSRSLTNRAADLDGLLDSMGQGIQTIQAANEGIEAVTSFIEQAKSVATSAFSLDASASDYTTQIKNYQDQYNEILKEIGTLAKDSSYQGINLLTGGKLTVMFNETRTHQLDVQGKDIVTDMAAANIGFTNADWINGDQTDTTVTAANTAMTTAQSVAEDTAAIGFASVTTSGDFTTAMTAQTAATPTAQLYTKETNLDGTYSYKEVADNAAYDSTKTYVKVTNGGTVADLDTAKGRVDTYNTKVSEYEAAVKATMADTINNSLDSIAKAIDYLRDYSSELGNNFSIIETRQNFTEALIDVLETGSDNLVLADMNEESANYLALQTRQQLAINSLALASQSAQSVLSLF